MWGIQRARQARRACKNSRPPRTRISCCSNGGGSSTCWVPNTGTGGPLELCAGTGGQLALMTGTRGLGMGGGLPYSTGVACSLIAPVGAGVGCSADGVMGDKGACCCVPDARAVIYGGIRAALHVRGGRGGRYVLLAPPLLAPPQQQQQIPLQLYHQQQQGLTQQYHQQQCQRQQQPRTPQQVAAIKDHLYTYKQLYWSR